MAQTTIRDFQMQIDAAKERLAQMKGDDEYVADVLENCEGELQAEFLQPYTSFPTVFEKRWQRS